MFEKSFHQILQEKLGASPQKSATNLSTMDASIQTLARNTADSTFIELYTLKSFEGIFKHGSDLYQKAARSSPPIKRKPHVLNPQQAQAYATLNAWEPLSPAFTARELKANFRRLVKRLHPDHGGNAEDFRALRSSYRELSLIFQGATAI